MLKWESHCIEVQIRAKPDNSSRVQTDAERCKGQANCHYEYNSRSGQFRQVIINVNIFILNEMNYTNAVQLSVRCCFKAPWSWYGYVGYMCTLNGYINLVFLNTPVSDHVQSVLQQSLEKIHFSLDKLKHKTYHPYFLGLCKSLEVFRGIVTMPSSCYVTVLVGFRFSKKRSRWLYFRLNVPATIFQHGSTFLSILLKI